MTTNLTETTVDARGKVESTTEKRAKNVAVAKQLFHEMWQPLVVAICWTIYRLYSNAGLRNLSDGIANFGAGFFFICWVASQWLRVKKQQKVEAGLETIEARVNRSIDNFDQKTKEIICNITGGDAYCYISLFNEIHTEHRGQVFVCVEPSGSLYEMFFVVISRPMLRASGNRARFRVNVGEIKSKIAQSAKADLMVEEGRHGSFYVDFYARNGNWRQFLNVMWVNGRRTIATQVKRDEKIIYERIDDDFPLGADGLVDWESDEPWVTHNIPQPAMYTAQKHVRYA